jgi:hypothetical protein
MVSYSSMCRRCMVKDSKSLDLMKLIRRDKSVSGCTMSGTHPKSGKKHL